MFAHFAQETGEHNNSDKEVEEWRQGLAHLRELGCTDTSPGENNNDAKGNVLFIVFKDVTTMITA